MDNQENPSAFQRSSDGQRISASVDQNLITSTSRLSQANQNISGKKVGQTLSGRAPLFGGRNERPGTTIGSSGQHTPSRLSTHKPTQQTARDASSMVIKNIANIPLPSQPPPLSVTSQKPTAFRTQSPVVLSVKTEKKDAAQKVEGSTARIALTSDSLKAIKVAIQPQAKMSGVGVPSSHNQPYISLTVPQIGKEKGSVHGLSSHDLTDQKRPENVRPSVRASESMKVITGLPLPHHPEGLSSLVSYSSSSSEASPSEHHDQEDQEDSNLSSVLDEPIDTSDNHSLPVVPKTETENIKTGVPMKTVTKQPVDAASVSSLQSPSSTNDCQQLQLPPVVERNELIHDMPKSDIQDKMVSLKEDIGPIDNKTMPGDELESMMDLIHGESQEDDKKEVEDALLKDNQKPEPHLVASSEEFRSPPAAWTTQDTIEEYEERVTGQDQKLFTQQAEQNQKLITQKAEQEQKLISQQAEQEQKLVGQKAEQEQKLVSQQAKQHQKLISQKAEQEQKLVSQKAEQEQKLVSQQAKQHQKLISQKAEQEQKLVSQKAEQEQKLVSQQAKQHQKLISQKAEQEQKLVSQQAERHPKLIIQQAKQVQELVIRQAEQEEKLVSQKAEQKQKLVAQQIEQHQNLISQQAESEQKLVSQKAEHEQKLVRLQAEKEQKLVWQQAEQKQKLVSQKAEQEQKLERQQAEQKQKLVSQKAEQEQKLERQQAEQEQKLVRQKTEQEQKLVSQKAEQEQKLVSQKAKQKLVSQKAEQELKLVSQKAEQKQKVVNQKAEQEQKLVSQKAEQKQKPISQKAEQEQKLVSQNVEQEQKLVSQKVEQEHKLVSQQAQQEQKLICQQVEQGQKLITQQTEQEQKLVSQKAEQEQKLVSQKTEQEQKLVSQKAEQKRKLVCQKAEQEQKLVSQKAEQEQKLVSQKAEQEQKQVCQKAKQEQKLVNQKAEQEQKLVSQKAEQEQKLESQKAEQEQKLISQKAEQEQKLVCQKAEQEQKLVSQKAEQEQKLVNQKVEQEQKLVSQKPEQEQKLVSQKADQEQKLECQKAKQEQKLERQKAEQEQKAEQKQNLVSQKAEQKQKLVSQKAEQEQKLVSQKAEQEQKLVSQPAEPDQKLLRQQAQQDQHIQPESEHPVISAQATVIETTSLAENETSQDAIDSPSIEDTLSEMGMALSPQDISKESEVIPLKDISITENIEANREYKGKRRVEEDVNDSSGDSDDLETPVPKKRARVMELSDSPPTPLEAVERDASRMEEDDEEEDDEEEEEEMEREQIEEARQDLSNEQSPDNDNLEEERLEKMEDEQMDKNDDESRDGMDEGGEDMQNKDNLDDSGMKDDKEDGKDDEDASTPSKRRKKKKKSYERPRGEGGKFMKEKQYMLDEETRMDYSMLQDEDSQGSVSRREVRRFRCEVIVPESTEVFTAEKVVEYVWPLEGIGEHYFIQEQISQYLGIMSFKRRYPDLRRRPIDMQERDYLKEKGLVSEIACDLGLTAVRSEDVLDVMFNDFPGKFEELQRLLREKKENEIRERGKVNYSLANIDKSKMQEYGRKAAADAARWNANFNKEKREDCRYSFDLQTFTLQMPTGRGKKLPSEYTKMGCYPVSVLPGQFTDHYREYSMQALKTMPLCSVVAAPVIPDALGSDGANSDSEEEGLVRTVRDGAGETKDEKPTEVGPRCKVCNGSKNRNKSGKPEPLIICGTCRSASHPTCIDLTLVMVPKIESYSWQCMDCKTCVTCSNPDDEDKMIFCDMCDRGYHIFCVGLRRVPNGRWHCKECAMCSSCGSKTPAGNEHLKNAEWQHEFKKDKDNKQLRYATTLCVPCDKYWKRRQFCYVCLKVYRSIPEDGMVRCSNCPKYIHREVCSTVYENERFCINCFKMRNSTALNHSRIIAAAKKKMASGY